MTTRTLWERGDFRFTSDGWLELSTTEISTGLPFFVAAKLTVDEARNLASALLQYVTQTRGVEK